MPATLVEADRFDAVLRALAAGAGTYFGDPNATLHPVKRLDRPFSSLMRVRVATAAGESYAFVKVFKVRQPDAEKERAQLRRFVENEYRKTLRLHEAFTSHPGLTALRPIAAFPEQLAVVTAEVQGQLFDRMLRGAVWRYRPAAAVVEAARGIGAWIRRYQEVTPADGRVSAGREYVDARLQALVGTVLTERDRELALEAFDALATQAGAADAPLVAIHGDLCPSNIVVQRGGAIIIVDFATAKTGLRYHDLAHLFLHLHRGRWRTPLHPFLLRSVQDALLAGFDVAASRRDPAFRLMLLQHSACQVLLLAQRWKSRGAFGVQALRRRWRGYMPLWTPDLASG